MLLGCTSSPVALFDVFLEPFRTAMVQTQKPGNYLRTEWSPDMGRAQVFAKDSQAVVVPDKMQLTNSVRAAPLKGS